MNLPTHAMLAAWLTARGMKSGAFGALIPVGKDVISKIINGKRTPNQHVADRIERLTGGDISSDQWGNNEKI